MKLIFIGIQVFIVQNFSKAQYYNFRYQKSSVFPAPKGFVSDYEQIFSQKFIQDNEQKLQQLQQKTAIEFALITVKEIKGYTHFVSYAIDLFNQWGIGKPDLKNGLAIIMSTQLGKIRITVGAGLLGKISDEFCKDVIENMMMPLFKQEAYEHGLQNGLNALLKKLE
ncbi:MAG: TPM domain-containing protein [Chitinophagaceae bacterium]